MKHWRQLRKRRNSLYLTVQQGDKRFHLSDHLYKLGHCRVVVLLWNPVQPLKVVLIQLQVSMQLRECGLQLETTQTYFRDLAWVWQNLTVWIETDHPLSLHKHAQTHSHAQTHYQSITSRLLRSLADLLLISGRDLNLWGSTSESNACSLCG